MVDLVFEYMPDDPLPGAWGKEFPLFFFHEGGSWEKLFQIGGSPAGKGVGNHLPGCLKPGNQLSDLAWSLPIVVPVVKIGIPFTHPPLEPEDSCANHMFEDYPNRPLMWPDREGKLFG